MKDPARKRSTGLARLLGCLALAAAAAVLPPEARSGDEDMSTSAYLVFDPETGEFVTVHDPNRTRQHAAEAELSGLSAAPVREATDARAGPSLPLAGVIGAALIVLVGAAGTWLRRKQRQAN